MISENFIKHLNSVLWGPAMITFIIAIGIMLTFATDFVQVRQFRCMLKSTIFSFGSKKKIKTNSISPFQAVSTAMAATIGTGSIAGLATAIVCGGPGSIFWLWVSAFLGMAIKYSEIVLSVKYRVKGNDGRFVGGPMYYIHNGLGSRFLAVLFSAALVFACFGIGNTVQSNSIAHAVLEKSGISPHTTGVILTVICAAVILGGIRRIAVVNERLVPIMALIYVVCCISALFIKCNKIPGAISIILSDAFSPKAVVGGGMGSGMILAVRYGFSRGIFSNEAGLGSAPVAHGAADTKEPVKQGMWGIFEVFFTTVVICTMTALVILVSGFYAGGSYSGMELAIKAFDSILGEFGGSCVSVSAILFALSSILGWAYYGEVGIGYVFPDSKKWIIMYRFLYVAMIYFGATGNLETVWNIAEIMNGLMAVPNLIAVIGLRKDVRSETQKYFCYRGANHLTKKQNSV